MNEDFETVKRELREVYFYTIDVIKNANNKEDIDLAKEKITVIKELLRLLPSILPPPQNQGRNQPPWFVD